MASIRFGGTENCAGSSSDFGGKTVYGFTGTSPPIKSMVFGIVAILAIMMLSQSCKNDCKLVEKDGYIIVETVDKKGKPYCYYEKIVIDNSCPHGCDNHTKDKCGEYFHGTDTTVHLEGDYTAVLHKCDKWSDTAKVKQPDACPTGCVNHTKSQCRFYVHKDDIPAGQSYLEVTLANGLPFRFVPCQEWADSLGINPDTLVININNMDELNNKLNEIKNTWNDQKKVAKVNINNPLRVDQGGYAVIGNFDKIVVESNGKIIAEWRDNFICPPINGTMLTHAQWVSMGKPKIGINPENGAKYNISSLEKDKFPDLSVLNIIIPDTEIEINSSQTLTQALTKIQQNQLIPVSDRPRLIIKFTQDFNVNNGGDIPNLEALIKYFDDTWAIFGGGTGKVYPATDSISVQNATLLAQLDIRDLLKETTISGQRYYFVHDASSLIVVPHNTFVRTSTVKASDGVSFSRAVPNEVVIDAEFDVQGLTPLHGQWPIPIKLTPVADPSKPGGEWYVVGVNDWFLNNWNNGPNSAFYSNTSLILGYYGPNSNSAININTGLDISAVNIDTLNNSFFKLLDSYNKVNDPTLCIIVRGHVAGTQLNIGNRKPTHVASDGRLYIHRDTIERIIEVFGIRPAPIILPPRKPAEHCLAASNMIVCHNNAKLDEQGIYMRGDTTYFSLVGINPATNCSVINESAVPGGKSVYVLPPPPNSVQGQGIQGIKNSKSNKVIWRGKRR
jgi:hypothetical protein